MALAGILVAAPRCGGCVHLARFSAHAGGFQPRRGAGLLFFGRAGAGTGRGDALATEAQAAEKAAREKVLAADPRDVLAGLDADTRARIERAEAGGVEAGLGAAREALHRSRRPWRRPRRRPRAAVDAAIPLAVQAAVAEERGKAAAQRLLTEARAEAYRKEALTWRALSLVAAGAGTGALANGGRGAVYGAAGGVVTALVWWLVELWPKKGGGGARP